MRKKVYKTTQPIRSQSDREAISSYFWNRNLRDYALFEFGIYTGRRISDMVKLNVRDVAHIDRKGHFCISERLIIQEKKTGKFIDMWIHARARRALGKYLKRRKKHADSLGSLLNEPLFKSQKARRDGQYRITARHALRVLSKAARACGLTDKIGTHSLRKTFGYMLYQKHVDIELIQKLLNHSSPEITLSYIGITQEGLDDAVKSLD